MSNRLQALEKVPPRVSDPKREKRDRTIRIRTYNYDRLAKLGDLSEDFDDAMTKVLDFYEKHHHEKEEKKRT
jgi:hypothetical protein